MRRFAGSFRFPFGTRILYQNRPPLPIKPKPGSTGWKSKWESTPWRSFSGINLFGAIEPIYGRHIMNQWLRRPFLGKLVLGGGVIGAFFTETKPKVPDGYEFSVRFKLESQFLGSVAELFKIQSKNDVGEISMVLNAYPKTGEFILDDIKCWAVNNEQFIELYFETEDDFKRILKKISDADHSLTEKNSLRVFRFDRRIGWHFDPGTDYEKPTELFGYDDHLAKIDKDIEIIYKYAGFLKKIGESRSLNYLYYGPPGTGKTTCIKYLAMKYKIPIYIVNPNNFCAAQLQTILSPSGRPKDKDKVRFVIFEDFDRFLEDPETSKIMSQILNSLNGLNDKNNIIRIFTCNNIDTINKNQAIINRMSSRFEFGMPTRLMLQKKLEILLSHSDKEHDKGKMDKYLDLAISKNISMRPFTDYCLKYAFDENPLDAMISHIAELDYHVYLPVPATPPKPCKV